MRRGQQVSRHYVAQSAQEFRPTYLSGCVLWLRADLGITLGGTLKATGTTPPAATISGTPNGLYGLHIEIDNAGGARGTATFKWSLDNGVTYQAAGVTTAATNVLGTTGITIAWPVGTYNADNKYDATVSQWNDQSGNGNHLTQATSAKQPVINAKGGPNSAAFLRYDGLDDGMAGSLGPAGFTNKLTSYRVVRAVSYINNGSPWASKGAAYDVAVYDIVNGGNHTRLNRAAGFVVEIAHPGAGLWFVQRVQFDGVNATLGQGGVVGSGANAANFDIGTQQQCGTGFDLPGNYDFVEELTFTRSLTAAENARVDSYIFARYGVHVT